MRATLNEFIISLRYKRKKRTNAWGLFKQNLQWILKVTWLHKKVSRNSWEDSNRCGKMFNFSKKFALILKLLLDDGQMYSTPFYFPAGLALLCAFLLCCFMFMHHSRNDLCHKELWMIHTSHPHKDLHPHTISPSRPFYWQRGLGSEGGKMYTPFIFCPQMHAHTQVNTQGVLHVIYDST